jgi:SP family sugar:H+ symporter-like MFS transporter
MGLFTKKKLEAQSFNTIFVQEKSVTDITPPPETPADSSEVNVSAQNVQGGNAATNNTLDKPSITTQAILLGAIASIGGFMFGYESGQISGMLKV